MRYFYTLLLLRLKAALRSIPFLIAAASVLCLSLTLAAALPQNAPLSLSVGVLPLNSGGEEIAALLALGGDYEIASYTDADAMTHDVLTGVLHCGYTLDTAAKTPITVLETDGSYLRPLLDELVLAAYFEVQSPLFAADYLEKNGLDGAIAEEIFDRMRTETTPMTIRLETNGQAGAVEALAARSIQPLLYAALVSVFLAASLLAALLTGDTGTAAGRYLAVFSRRPLASALAPVAANVLLYAALLAVADLLMNLFVETPAYSGTARFVLICVLSVFTAIVTLAALPLRRFSGAVIAALPPALIVSVLCSGAILNPALLPAGLGFLRFLSPAWYALHLLELF